MTKRSQSARAQHSELTRYLQQGRALHQQGRLAEAEGIYRQVLAHAPAHPDALHLLGVLALQVGRAQDAVELIRSALKVNPNQHSALANLAAALRETGQLTEALASIDRSLRLKSDAVDAHVIRGSILRGLRRAAEALANYDRAIQLSPDSPYVLCERGHTLLELQRLPDALECYEHAVALAPADTNMMIICGNALLEGGHAAEALSRYQRAIELQPDSLGALSNCAAALCVLQRFPESLAIYDRILQLQPDFVDAINNRGNVLLALQRHQEALQCYDRALELSPQHLEAHINRGRVSRELGRPGEALASFDRALQLRPELAEALNSRGAVLHDLGRIEEGLESIERALALVPEYPGALYNQGIVFLALTRMEDAARSFEKVVELVPEHDYALGHLMGARLHCCDWRDYDENVRLILDRVAAGKRACFPFSFLGLSDSAPLQSVCARTFAADKYRASPSVLAPSEPYRHEKIRLAYLSADFHSHATAHLIAELFERHDRQRFELTAISFGPDDGSAMRGRLERSFDRFLDVRGQSDFEVAQRIRALEIDLAVDLNGFTVGNRTGILSHRPAPVQVSYLVYPATMGAEYIDYIIADRHVIPARDSDSYVERVVYLPDCYQVNDTQRAIAGNTPSRAEVGLPAQGFVFCCFNNSYKITPPIFDIWMRLLLKVPGSVLWLLQREPSVAANLRQEAAARCVLPERLVFAPPLPLDAHLARHRLADLFLDTVPVNAHTTASDALWAGLPVVTCMGGSFAARVAGSLLNGIGLSELAVEDLERYESLALELAMNPDRLRAVRSRLETNRATHPLFDVERSRRHIEAAYLTMWERHQRGESPASFAVDPIA